LSINTVQLPHTKGKISVRRFNEKVKVIGHETVSVANPIVALTNVLNGIQEFLTILIVLEDRPFPVAAGSNMVNGAGIFYAEGSGHGQ
jgi:hypothetical protein